jgi:uncharacterized protein YcbK (DUF882 family)
MYRHLLTAINPIGLVDPSARVTSWYRDADHNRSVGGSPQSQHLYGFALDITSDRPELVIAAARSAGLHVVDEMDHIHLQLFPAGFLADLGLF